MDTLAAKLAALAVVPEDTSLPAWWVREVVEEVRQGLPASAAERQWASHSPHTRAEVEGFFTADEVAQLTRLPKKQVYELARRGTIPSRKIGRRVLFSKQAFRDWLDHGTE